MDFSNLPVFETYYLEVLLELEEDGTPSVVDEILGQFRVDAAQLFTELAAALNRSSLTEVANLAHSLKGGTAQLGMSRLSGMARFLEQSALDGQGDGLSALLEPARAACEEALREIDLFLTSRRA